MIAGAKGITGGYAGRKDGRTFAEVFACAKARAVELTFEQAA
jgi:hypothetical protein